MYNKDLPGISKECVEICVEEGCIIIRAERRNTGGDPNAKFHIMERNNGKLERYIRIPEDADVHNIVADFNLGHLEITIPKHTNAIGPVKIPIRF